MALEVARRAGALSLRLRVAWPRPRYRWLAVGLGVIVAIGLAALAAPWLSPYTPEEQSIVDRLQPPSVAHWLGTDALGRDLLTRVLWGGRVSLAIGLLSMAIAVGVSVLVGATAGYFGGRIDALLMRLTELVLVFPPFFFIILVLATFGNSIPLLVAVIGLTSWPVGARIVRGEVLKLKTREFVLAARALGASSGRIILRHLLPNILAVIISSATIRVGANILVEAGLSYLGLGVQPPLASWGNIVAEGARVIRTAWWVTAAPAAAIFLTVLAFNLLGEGLRDALDPRARPGQLP
ncbi:MAG: ABC transporter permease [Chloroflexi bacterium]|nr:ABC transporter permease [Chloroflexota bacterium]